MPVFRGSETVRVGVLTRGQLRGPAVQLAEESRLQSRVRGWLVLDGLRPAPQHWIEDSRGRLARVDLAFVEQRVAVEYDGSWREGEPWALNRDTRGQSRLHQAPSTINRVGR